MRGTIGIRSPILFLALEDGDYCWSYLPVIIKNMGIDRQRLLDEVVEYGGSPHKTFIGQKPVEYLIFQSEDNAWDAIENFIDPWLLANQMCGK